MKLFIEKLPLSNNTSFVSRTHTTPLFEAPWHQHTEYELILITRGIGLSFIGNYVGDFEPGDIFFLGSNLPHTFQKSSDGITSAVIVHFTDDFWGREFLGLPETKNIRNLFDVSAHGLKIMKNISGQLSSIILTLETSVGFRRIISLCECLDLLSSSSDNYHVLSSQELNSYKHKNRERIDRIFQYSMDHFKEPVQLSHVAGIANMSIPAFCNYFKKTTRKKYIDFLNEIRIGYACQRLLDSQSSIIEICYESGFNNLANFNRQFLKIKAMTPSKFRKAFALDTDSVSVSLDNREIHEKDL